MPHAVLIQGQPGIGKRRFALELAHSLLCSAPGLDGHACGSCPGCQLIDAGTHPDLQHLDPQPPKDSKSAHPVLSIKVDTIRHLCERLSTTSQYGGYRVAVIDDAEKMVNAAANSLLKTLEEPGAETMIILTSSRPGLLPVTIRSRCQSIELSTPEHQKAREWMESMDIDDADRRLALANGAPLLAADDEMLNLAGRARLRDAIMAKAEQKTALAYADDISGLPKHDSLSWMLEWVSDLVRLSYDAESRLTNESDRAALQKITERIDTARLLRFRDKLSEAVRLEPIALNQLLLWENLLISWDNL